MATKRSVPARKLGGTPADTSRRGRKIALARGPDSFVVRAVGKRVGKLGVRARPTASSSSTSVKVAPAGAKVQRRRAPKLVRYSTTWRIKGGADGARSIEAMARKLEAEAGWLRKMGAAGIRLAGKVEDDYATLETTDAKAAERFGLERDDEGYG